MSHRVRIAQKGWKGSGPAESADDVAVGLGVLWVEIDGHRFEEVFEAQVVARHDEFTPGAALTFQLIGPVEIVYVGADGEELSSVEARETPLMAYGTAMPVPEEATTT